MRESAVDPAARRAVALKRRAFLLGSAAMALGVPLAARGQSRTGTPRILVLALSAPPDHTGAFEEGLRALGYTPGSTLIIEHRSAESRATRMSDVARQALGLHPDVIVAVGATAAIAVHRETKELPIVAVTGDIVAAGLVIDVARPEGNVTGLSFFGVDLNLKRLELLSELAPQLRRLAVVVQSPLTPTLAKMLVALRSAAQAKGMQIREVLLARVEDVKGAFASVREPAAEGLLLVQSPIFDARAEDIGRLAADHRLIAVLPWKEYVQAGGLVSYAPDILAVWRRAATYVDRLLRGARPGDLPVEQPTKFELVINLKTARALGLTIPPSLLVRADQVIE